MLIPDPDALSIVRKLKDQGYISYYAGGCVRDALLGRQYKDIDIATDASPQDVLSLFRRTVAVGAHFGVVKVLKGDMEFDVATFRKDGDYTDGRHPDSVTFCTPEEDALRRDITINGLFYDPLEDDIKDFVGGRDDLEKGLIRAIGDPVKRIEEDRLRMLRVLRFGGTLGFSIDPDTLRAVREMKEEIASVSIERITEELSRMLGSSRPADCMHLMVDTGMMGEIVPEFMAMDGVKQPEQFHPEGDVLQHTMLMFDLFQAGMKKTENRKQKTEKGGNTGSDAEARGEEESRESNQYPKGISPGAQYPVTSNQTGEGEESNQLSVISDQSGDSAAARSDGSELKKTERFFSPSLAVGLAVLFHDIGKPPTYVEAEDRIRFSGHCVKGGRMTGGIMRRLRFPGVLIDRVSELVAQHMKFMAVRDMRISTLKRFIRQDWFEDHLDLHWLDCMASHKDLDSYNFCIEKLEEFSREKEKLKPPRIVSGQDLIREGYTPGPLFGEILEFIEDLQLEQGMNDREEILTEVRNRFPLAGNGYLSDQ